MESSLSPGCGSEDFILVLRAGDALTEVVAEHGEYCAWIQRAAGDAWHGAWREHDLRSASAPPECKEVAAVVITGSPASVTERAPWMLQAEAYIRRVIEAQVPLLGICFGHQLIAQALGGNVRKNPRGREIGTVEVTTLAPDPLFEGLPDRFLANATHVDTVADLPPGATVVASTALEPHAALAFGALVRGVQFHPEIDEGVMRGYVEVRRQRLREEGLDAEAILAQAADTPLGRELLRNFIRRFVVPPARRAA
jgi:GMP synthase (glutamine-hydrolysing)